MAQHNELAALLSNALWAVNRALNDGDELGLVGEWELVPLEHHSDHLAQHIIAVAQKLQAGTLAMDDEDLDHAIFRLLTIKARLLKSTMAERGELDS